MGSAILHVVNDLSNQRETRMELVDVPCTMTFFDLNIKWASNPAPAQELALTLWFKGDDSLGLPDMSFPIDFALSTKKVSYPEISHSKLSPSIPRGPAAPVAAPLWLLKAKP